MIQSANATANIARNRRKFASPKTGYYAKDRAGRAQHRRDADQTIIDAYPRRNHCRRAVYADLIKTGGNAEDTAKRAGLSVRQVYNHKRDFRRLGLDPFNVPFNCNQLQSPSNKEIKKKPVKRYVNRKSPVTSHCSPPAPLRAENSPRTETPWFAFHLLFCLLWIRCAFPKEPSEIQSRGLYEFAASQLPGITPEHLIREIFRRVHPRRRSITHHFPYVWRVVRDICDTNAKKRARTRATRPTTGGKFNQARRNAKFAYFAGAAAFRIQNGIRLETANRDP